MLASITSHDIWIVAHLLLFVYWLGGDVGQFYLSFHVRKPDLEPSTRLLLAKYMVAIDQGPRICLVLMLPVGLTLAGDLFLSLCRGAGLAAVWVASLAWLAAVLALHFRQGASFHDLLRRADMALRVVLAVGLLGAAMVSLVDGEPFRTDWLAWKVAIYAACIALGLGIRWVIRDFGPAIGRIVSEGSTPDNEAALQRSLLPAYPLVVGIWVLLIAAATMGVAKP